MFLLILNESVHAQYIDEFYTQINIASKLAKTGKADDAVSRYEDAFAKVEYVHTRYLEKGFEISKIE